MISWAYNKFQSLVYYILSAGPIPQHVAFIMDGNRRFARRKGQGLEVGYNWGYVALRRMLEICLRLNVRCVSVYAFAIENFKRSEEDTKTLFDLAEDKLLEMAQHGDLLDEYGVRLNIVGRKEMFPDSVRAAMTRVENMTKHNNRSVLNLCMAYASRDEITYAVNSAVRLAVERSKEYGVDPYVTVEDIDSQTMTSLAGSPPVDILVRSSGVKRLSDFLTWQCCDNTQIHFSEAYWPEFGLWDFLPIILNFQRKVWSQEAERRHDALKSR